VLWLGRRYRLTGRQWGWTLLAGGLGVAWFAGPGFLRNWRAYGSVLAPRDWVERVHRSAESADEFCGKLGRNLVASLAQNCEPHSQPHGLREAGRRLGMALATVVAERDRFTLDDRSREEALRDTVFSRTKPDADVTTFGLVTLGLCALSTGLAVARRRRSDSRMILVWAGGIAVFLIYFHAMQQWHQFGFRYFVLVAPWVAVVAAWGLEQLPGRARWVGWAVALLAAVGVAWEVTGEVEFTLLVKTWDEGRVRLALENPDAVPVVYALATPVRTESGALAAKSNATIELALPPGLVSEVTVRFRRGDGHPLGAGGPAVGLAP
jgi:hypothetical protein